MKNAPLQKLPKISGNSISRMIALLVKFLSSRSAERNRSKNCFHDHSKVLALLLCRERAVRCGAIAKPIGMKFILGGAETRCEQKWGSGGLALGRFFMRNYQT